MEEYVMKKAGWIFGLVIMVGLFSLSIFQPEVRYFFIEAIDKLSSADIGVIKEYLLSFGVWAPIVSALLMIFSVVVTPFPAFVITFANGLVFGALWGGLLTWTSALAGAALCFYMARILGKPVVERFVGRKALDWTDQFIERYGIHSILLARVIPIVSYGIVSYAAGLTSMRFVIYLIGTAIGQTPATILYSYLGEHAAGSIMILFWAFVVVIGMSIIGAALKPWFDRRIKGR
jgi:uncharacterized membrane protein YdjX (TVP38/TMEM64 family)